MVKYNLVVQGLLFITLKLDFGKRGWHIIGRPVL